MTRLVMQRRAMRDLADARAFYRREAPHMVADFASAIDAELKHLRLQPATGSPRFGLRLGIAGLRSWPVKRFLHPVFYIDQGDHISVVRVLHQSRDLPAHLETDSDSRP